MKKSHLFRFVIVFVLGLILQAGYIIVDGVTNELGPADAIVVLGSKVEVDGRPSESLKSRLDKAYELYQKGLSRKIIVSGGFDKAGREEAAVMKNYLEARGVPAGNLIADKQGFNTYQTAVFVKGLEKSESIESVIAVSQYFHLTRCKLALRKAGVRKVYAVHARLRPELRDLYSIPREIAAFYYYFFRNYPAI